MIVSLIAAVAKNNVIGKNNKLIWSLPKDMKFFMDTTMGHHIIMGRRNYESIPDNYRPLKNRTNIIVTKNYNYTASDCIVVDSIQKGISYAEKKGEKECFIIGGGQIYKLALELNLIDRLYITHIFKNFEGDTLFPDINYNEWYSELLFEHTADKTNPYDFKVIKYYK